MGKTLIGITSWGNFEFLKLAIDADQKTLTRQADILVIVAKPGDTEMSQWLAKRGIPFIAHEVNKGFAASVNDIFEYGWVKNGYDNIIIQGNDVLPYAGALDAMIDCAETTDWEWICATQFDSKTLVSLYPDAAKYFHGPNLTFTDFAARPWDMHHDLHAPMIEPDAMKDVRNLALFKRSVFENIGYTDVNYWPNAYYEDNDAVFRALKSGVRACGLREAVYFHFWSRTIHQGEGRAHSQYFVRNGDFYRYKFGGPVMGETYQLPFNGQPFQLTPGIVLQPELKIASRDHEEAIIKYWSSL